jgi:hypothetical protein
MHSRLSKSLSAPCRMQENPDLAKRVQVGDPQALNDAAAKFTSDFFPGEHALGCPLRFAT